MKFRRRGGFRRKPPQQWVVSGGGYSTATGGGSLALTKAAPLNTVELVGSTPVASFDPPVIDRYTIQAIRGQIQAGLGASVVVNPFYHLALGIIKISVTTGGAGSALDPSNPADAGAGWLWLNHTVFSPNQGFADTGLAQQIEVIVKSKRSMREGERLILAGKADGFAAVDATQVTVFAWLRTLIRRVA